MPQLTETIMSRSAAQLQVLRLENELLVNHQPDWSKPFTTYTNHMGGISSEDREVIDELMDTRHRLNQLEWGFIDPSENLR